MKIGILTSSRADFGIYHPLVKELVQDSNFEVEIIVFGTHLKKEYGYTVDEIRKFGFDVKHKVETPVKNDTAEDIAINIGTTIQLFSNFWNNNTFDFVFALGDRYEMFAAVTASSPFNITIAHIHAGETTLGAIDNSYRHSISLMSKFLFVSTEDYKRRATEIIKRPDDVFNVGALSIDNLKEQELYTKNELKEIFNIDFSTPSILSTFHPETVSYTKNEEYIEELICAFNSIILNYQLIITLPNSDTLGGMIRKKLVEFANQSKNVFLFESLGMKGYLSCMKHCSFLLGNTSSGFAEAAHFPKWVINIGTRQKGRLETPNIITTPIKSDEIIDGVKYIESTMLPSNCNIYGDGNTAFLIISKIKDIYGLK